VVTNHSKRRIGLFRQPDVFSVGIYNDAPEGKQEQPMNRTLFRLDKKGIGSCYDTVGGTGISGHGAADIHEKKRGLHILWIVLFVLLGGGVIIASAKGFGYFAGKMLTPSAGPAGSGPVVASAPPASRSFLPIIRSHAVSESVSKPEAISVVVRQSDVFLTAVSWLGEGRYMVTLSDGRVLRTDRGDLKAVGVDWCRDSGGRVYVMRGHNVSKMGK